MRYLLYRKKEQKQNKRYREREEGGVGMEYKTKQCIKECETKLTTCFIFGKDYIPQLFIIQGPWFYNCESKIYFGINLNLLKFTYTNSVKQS